MTQDEIQSVLQQATQAYNKGDLAKAGSLANRVYAVEPDNHHALYVLAMVANTAGRSSLAVTLLEQAIARLPSHPHYHFQLGSLLQGMKRIDQAKRAYQEALRLKPDFYEAYLNLGSIYFAEDDVQEARRCFSLATTYNAEHATAHFNLGILDQEQGNHEGALQYLDRALAFGPTSAGVHMARAFSLLMLERFHEGWLEYEWRWQLENLAPRICPKPRWMGESLEGKRIYVYTEQGFGDAIMMSRYLNVLRSQGVQVHFECKKELYRLFSLSGVSDKLHVRLPDDGEPPPFDYDYHVPIMSLPGFFTQTLADIPSTIPYLCGDQGRIDYWRERLQQFPGLKVGLNWSGNPTATANRNRACTLRDMYPLTDIPGIHFFSLQKDTPAEELRFVDREKKIIDLSGELQDFAETAAVLVNLDLLISTDTAVVHLAGALGVPAWTMLHTGAEWRWLAHRNDSPWYPGMRLFRQSAPRDWRSLVERVAEALRLWVFGRFP